MSKPRLGTTWRGPAYQDKRPLHIESSPNSHRSLCGKRLSLVGLAADRPLCKKCITAVTKEAV